MLACIGQKVMTGGKTENGKRSHAYMGIFQGRRRFTGPRLVVQMHGYMIEGIKHGVGRTELVVQHETQ